MDHCSTCKCGHKLQRWKACEAVFPFLPNWPEIFMKLHLICNNCVVGHKGIGFQMCECALLCLLPADQHLLQWRPAPVRSRVSRPSAGRGALCGTPGSVLHRVLPGPHSSPGLHSVYPLLSSHGEIPSKTSATKATVITGAQIRQD